MQLASNYYIQPLFVIFMIFFSFSTFQFFNQVIPNEVSTLVSVYLNFLGVVYAVIAAFVIFEAGSRLTGINEEMGQEFIAIRNMFSMIKLIKDKKLVQLAKEKIKDYCITLKKKLYVNGPKSREEVSKKFRGIFLILDRIKPRNEMEKVLSGHVVDALRSSANSRSRRLGLIESEIPKLELLLVIFLSISLVFGFFLIRVSSAYIFTTIMSIVTIAVSFIMLVMFDLNNPFKGFWNISSEPIDRTLEFIEEK